MLSAPFFYRCGVYGAALLLMLAAIGCQPSAGTAQSSVAQTLSSTPAAAGGVASGTTSSGGAAGAPGAGTSFHPSLEATLCLDVAGDISQDGESVVLASCAPTATQSWQLVQGRFQTQGRCVDVSDANAAAGASLELTDCAAGDALQQWTFSNGHLQLGQTTYCMALPAATAQAGQTLQLATCVQNADTQLFNQAAYSASADPNTAARRIDIVNKCSQSLYVNNGTSSFVMAQNTNTTGYLPHGWIGRIWARADCMILGATATCGAGIPLTLGEFAFDGYANLDYYDISLVDGFNITMGIAPQGGPPGTCHAPICSTNILATCASDLQQLGDQNKVIACLSGCSRYHTDADCCQNANNSPATCPQPSQAVPFKQACPDAYSYPYDDSSSTWTCRAPTGYTVTFCPP